MLQLTAQAQIDFPDFCLLLCAVLRMSKKTVRIVGYPHVLHNVLCWVCMEDFGKWVGYRGVFCEKGPEACPVSNGANAIQLQAGPTTGQG